MSMTSLSFLPLIDTDSTADPTNTDMINSHHLADFRNSHINFLYENSHQQSNTFSGKVVFKVHNLTVLTPDRNRVVLGAVPSVVKTSTSSSSGSVPSHSIGYSGVNIAVHQGDTLLIVGPSGCGKSSFLRAIAGLWTAGAGSITWVDSDPNNNIITNPMTAVKGSNGDSKSTTPSFVFFLPQKPYNVLGTLKDQVRYPKVKVGLNTTAFSHNSSTILDLSSSSQSTDVITVVDNDNDDDDDDDDDLCLDILRKVRLESLASRVGNNNETHGLRSRCDWSKILSLGEQQRLAFARILYNKPSVVFLDEATSALDLDSEQIMYDLLRDMNITYLSVGHRPSLVKFHNRKLMLQQGTDIATVDITDDDRRRIIESTADFL